jgi:hypothetical protein
MTAIIMAFCKRWKVSQFSVGPLFIAHHIPVVGRAVYGVVCGRSLAGIADSKPAGSMDVCLL